MRSRALLCRLRKLHNVVPQTESNSRPTSDLLLQRGITRVAKSGARSRVFGDGSGGFLQNGSVSVGSVRMMGVGSFKEGNRAGQHGVKYPQGKPDGSPEKQESDAREEFLEKAKESSPSGAQEPIHGTTTELKFGVKDGKNTTEAIENASEELFRQSTINAKPGAGPIKEEDKRKYPEHQRPHETTQAQAHKHEEEEEEEERHGPTTQQVDLQGRQQESPLGGQQHRSVTDEATASGETARENIDNTRSEMRAGKARSPQAGVIVGHVASAGANAIENEDDVPDDAVEWEKTGEETLDKAQKMYEQAVAGFGTEGEKNLKNSSEDTSDAKFNNA